jgi:hypothetical protein
MNKFASAVFKLRWGAQVSLRGPVGNLKGRRCVGAKFVSQEASAVFGHCAEGTSESPRGGGDLKEGALLAVSWMARLGRSAGARLDDAGCARRWA